MLEVQHHRAWYGIVTLDDSWFYPSPDPDINWLPRDKTVTEREPYTVQSKKLMLTVAWNPRGFHLIDVLAKGGKFNAVYFVAETPSA
jgi:hypothetical protein